MKIKFVYLLIFGAVLFSSACEFNASGLDELKRLCEKDA